MHTLEADLVLAVLAYLALHLLAGHLIHGARRRRGHRLNYGWSLWRGPWVSWRIFGGTWYRHV